MYVLASVPTNTSNSRISGYIWHIISFMFCCIVLFEEQSCIMTVLYAVTVTVVLVVSGEGYGFLQFAWSYPRILVQLFVFSLCSSVGQVSVCLCLWLVLYQRQNCAYLYRLITAVTLNECYSQIFTKCCSTLLTELTVITIN